jgi:hypothetical protein
LNIPYDKSGAVVALPVDIAEAARSAAVRRWLARADLGRDTPRHDPLRQILGVLNLPSPEAGLGALRLWGQTGDRPGVWIAAADPVYLEPRLDHLRLHALQDSVPASELGALVDHLQQTLVDDGDYGFARVGPCVYLRAERPVATADAAPAAIDGRAPDAFMPTGAGAADYLRLCSEVEMALHGHEVNERREARGLPPVNGLWLWGGGVAPQAQTVPHPPLFGGDPLLRGHWHSRTAVVIDWPGSIAACLEQSLAGFVAVVPADEADSVDERLLELRQCLSEGRVSRITLLFADGVEARLRRSQAWRIWRRSLRMPA